MEPVDKLEEVFRQLEEESERRAREEEMDVLSPPVDGCSTGSTARRNSIQLKKKRRGSISVSRIGADLAVLQPSDSSSAISPPETPVALSAVIKNTMYQVQTGSASSLTSDESEGVSDAEVLHTTQKETIVTRRNTLTKAVGDIFSRTLTHVRSKNTLRSEYAAEEAVVIGVSVEEATVQHEAEHDALPPALMRHETTSAWVTRNPNAVRRSHSLNNFTGIAKRFAQKLRRKVSKSTAGGGH